jgi:hypothetical protein
MLDLSKVRSFPPIACSSPLQILAGLHFNSLNDMPAPVSESHQQTVTSVFSSSVNQACTVLIEDLPNGTTLRDIMPHIAGGAVSNVTIIDTASITGSLSCLVEFVTSKSAKLYTNFRQQHPLQLQDKDCSIRLLPCLPFTMEITPQKLFVTGETRVIAIGSSQAYISTQMINMLLEIIVGVYSNFIEKVGISHDNTIVIRFSGIRTALESIRELRRDLRKVLYDREYGEYYYNGLTFRSVADPCNRPVETLLSSTSKDYDFISDHGHIGA